MASVLSYLRELNIVTMMLRILLAVLCGGLIGLERERKNRPAGFRTYMLTALGATLTVLLSLQLDQMLHGPWRALAESIGATQDVSRFGAEVFFASLITIHVIWNQAFILFYQISGAKYSFDS